MNRADKIFIGCIVLVALSLYIPLLYSAFASKDYQKEVVVSFKDHEVLRKPLQQDATYTVDGSLGSVEVEVKDEKVRVEKETSPYHLCSIQGWVEESNRPIVCLPNNIVVEIKVSDAYEAEVDTVIQ